MRLTAASRIHWHAADEWALVLTGNCRLTAIDFDGSTYVNDVKAGNLWYFPTGIPHSLQGLEPDGGEFLLVFDDGSFSEDNTTLLSDWMIHTLPKSLRRIGACRKMPSIRPKCPGHLKKTALQPQPQWRSYQNRLRLSDTGDAATKSNTKGEVRIVDSSNFSAAANIAMAHVTLKPGGLRELHWHPMLTSGNTSFRAKAA